MLWKKIQTNVPIISFVLLTILVSYYAGSKQLIQWISPLQREPSSYIMPEGKQQLLAGEKMDLKNFEYFAKTLDCRDKNSYQNQSYKSEALEFLSNKQIISRCSDCSGYFDTINSNGFAPSTQVEVETPLAFAFTVHKEIGILEVFLSLYFRPTDAYCIHVDAKADTEIFKTVSSLVHCYNEVFPDSLVFLPRQAIPVFWGSGGSTMEADFICYRELMARSNKWKYVGNVAGTELPFVSIQRFRQKLKEANGYSFTIGKNSFADRMKHFWELERIGPLPENVQMKNMMNVVNPGPPPCGIEVFKGYKNGAFSSELIKFVTSNPFTMAFYKWIFHGTLVEEHFMNTIGSLTIKRVENTKKQWKIWQQIGNGVKYQNFTLINDTKWITDETACYKEYEYNSSNNNCSLVHTKCKKSDEEQNKPFSLWSYGLCYRSSLWFQKCHGKNVRGICNFAVEDLPKAKNRTCLIGNKFDLGVDISAVWCQYKEINKWTRNYDPKQIQNGL